MCDTMCFLSDTRSIFGKNSDRDPGELQLLFFEEPEVYPPYDLHAPYLNSQFKVLENAAASVSMKYPALVSCPSWIWGAEMGMNDRGVTIGNEAVFSRRVPRSLKDQGLLGMDILRLALHSSKDAEEAESVITELLSRFGQGGNGSRNHRLFYQNSFLIMDGEKAIKIETSGSSWASKDISGNDAISNSYSMRNDYSRCWKSVTGKDVKKYFEHPVMSFFSKGDFRRRNSCSHLAGLKPETALEGMKNTLRSHLTNDGAVHSSMKSLCVHARGLVKSETTASMITDYSKGQPVLWATASPYPCISLYKPFVLSNDLPEHHLDREAAFEYAERRYQRQVDLFACTEQTRKEIRALAEEYEKNFELLVHPPEGSSENFGELAQIICSCLKEQEQYDRQVDTLITA